MFVEGHKFISLDKNCQVFTLFIKFNKGINSLHINKLL